MEPLVTFGLQRESGYRPTLFCSCRITPWVGYCGGVDFRLRRVIAMNNELLSVLEYIERERGIDRETLIQAVESALLTASKKSAITAAHDLRIAIDRKTYDIHAYAQMRVVEAVTNADEEVTVTQARRAKPTACIGDVVEVEITPKNFGRIAAQTAKQAILQRIRQVEKDRVYEEFKDSVGEIISGAVRRFEHNDIIVDLGRTEAVLPSRERVPSEDYQAGERLRFLVLRVDNTPQGTEIVLSRSHPDFVRRLFELEVTEIADGTVEIKSIAREAGFRSKVAVTSKDEKVDPVGACVGLRGIRVKNIVRELSGEKIDIVRWSDDVKTYVVNALAPAKLSKVDVDTSTRTVYVTVEPDQLSLAIGKKGQNARLTAKLTNWKIDIRREEVELAFEEKVAQAVAGLAHIDGIDQQMAEKLVHAGFLTVEGILAADVSDLESIEGFNKDIALMIHSAAERSYEKEHGTIEEV